MNDSAFSDEKEILSLKSAIQAKERIIQKQQAKIQVLHDTLISNQQIIRKLESAMANSNQRTSSLQSQNQILQTNCEHLKSQIQKKKILQGTAGDELQKKSDDLLNAQNEHIQFQERIKSIQSEFQTSNETESKLLQKVADLSNQKRQLEAENEELKQYQSLAEKMQTQLQMAKLQIQQLESIYNQTQESIGVREGELIKLKGENEILLTKLSKVKTANKKFEKQVLQLNDKMQAVHLAANQLDEIQNQIITKDQEILEIKTKNQMLTEKIKKMKSKRSDKSAKSQIHRLENELKLKEQELLQHQQLLKSFQTQFQMNHQGGLYNNNNNLNNYMNFPLGNDNFANNPSMPLNNNYSNNSPIPFNNFLNNNHQIPNNLMNPNSNFNSNQHNNNFNFNPNLNNNMNPNYNQSTLNGSKVTLADYMNLKEQYHKLKEKYTKLKQEKKATLEEIYSLKLSGARLEDDLSTYEKIIASLKQEREELKTKLTTAETFLDQYTKRMSNAERETALIREHMMTVNANQDEVASLQLENNQLRKRMDELEKDLLVYTERKKKNVIRPTRPRRTAMVQ